MRVVPEILLERGARRRRPRRVGQHLVFRMPAADARGLHRARGGEIGRTEADALHARRGGRDRLDIHDALGGFQDGVDQDRLVDAMPRFELRQQLIEIMDVPRPIDLRQHDDVELVADGGDQFGDVVQHPGRIERVDAGPQPGRAEIGRLRHRDETVARGLLGVGRDRVLEIAEHHIDLARELRHLGASPSRYAAARNGSCARAGPAIRASERGRRRRAA